MLIVEATSSEKSGLVTILTIRFAYQNWQWMNIQITSIILNSSLELQYQQPLFTF